MAAIAEAQTLRNEIIRSHKVEALKLAAQDWKGNRPARAQASITTLQSRQALLALVDAAEKLPNAPDQFSEAKRAVQAMHFDLVRNLVAEPTSTENRLAKTVEYSKVMKDQRDRYLGLVKSKAADLTSTLKTFISGCKAVSSFLAKLARDPLKFAKLALDFVNGRCTTFVVKHISRAMGWATTKAAAALGKSVPDVAEAKAFTDLFARYPKVSAILDKVLAVFKGAAIAVQVVTTFFSEMSRKGNWSVSVTKAAVTGAFTATTIVFADAIEAAIGTTLTTALAAAGFTVEVPPVALVLAAAGLVMVAGIALVGLFDFLIRCAFGSLHVKGLSTPLSISTVASLDTPLAAKLNASLLPD